MSHFNLIKNNILTYVTLIKSFCQKEYFSRVDETFHLRYPGADKR